MTRKPNAAIRFWVVAGLLAYIALPWYAIQDTAWYVALPQVLGSADTANGLVQALLHKRKWLLLGLAGLVMAAAAIGMPPGRQQGNWLRGPDGQRLSDRRQRLGV
jgi:iron(III) transport system permease protein